MGQDIALLLTKATTVNVPTEITHFIENETLIIPLEEPIEIGFLIANMIQTDNFRLNDYGTSFQFVKLANQLKLQSYMVYRNAEFGGTPDEHFEFTVINGEILKDHIWISETKMLHGEALLNPNDYIDSNPQGIRISKLPHYTEYWACRMEYEKLHNLPSSFETSKKQTKKSLWEGIKNFFR